MLVVVGSERDSPTTFSPLPNAAREASWIAKNYPYATLLTAEHDTRRAVLRALSSATAFHFGGHAVADEFFPQQSYLLLRESGNFPHAGHLTAGEIEQLDLRRLQLVVLAACETLGVSSLEAPGFRGLAAAFQHAGARGVVGSLWRVSDDFTGALMIELHRAYRQSGDGAAALRTAQLSLLYGSTAALQSPAAWGGFEYSED
jgi:CHAT domain-containing protein